MPLTYKKNEFYSLFSRHPSIKRQIPKANLDKLQQLYIDDPQTAKRIIHFISSFENNMGYKAIVLDELSSESTEREGLLEVIDEAASFFPTLLDHFPLSVQIEVKAQNDEQSLIKSYLDYVKKSGFKKTHSSDINPLLEQIRGDFKYNETVRSYFWRMALSELSLDGLKKTYETAAEDIRTELLTHIGGHFLLGLLGQNVVLFHQLPVSIKDDPDFVKEYLGYAANSENPKLLEEAKAHISPLPIDSSMLKEESEENLVKLVCLNLITLPEEGDLILLKEVGVLSPPLHTAFKNIISDFNLIQKHEKALAPFLSLINASENMDQLNNLIRELAVTVKNEKKNGKQLNFFEDAPSNMTDGLHALYRVQARRLGMGEAHVQGLMKNISQIEKEVKKQHFRR